MKKLFNFMKFLNILLLEGMLHRSENGDHLVFFSLRAIGSNMLLAGIIGIAIGIVWTIERANFEINARTTISEVVKVRSDNTNDGVTVYELTLEWVDHNGIRHVTVPRVRSGSYNVPIGTVVDIAYDPEDPGDIRIQTVEGPWFIPVMILIGSTSSLLIGWFLKLRAKG